MNPTLQLTIKDEHGLSSITLKLSSESCWATILASFPLPCQGALDQLDAFFVEHPSPESITITSCPSAALLPMVWIRSIWFPVDTPKITLDWQAVCAPITQAQHPAARLGCMLADHIECVDPAQALALWGLNPELPTPSSEEAFDLLTCLVDLWDTDLSHVVLETDWNESLRQALLNCAALGLNTVAIYGAGTHTRAVAEALMEPAVNIVCIIDDDTRRQGQRLWGYEIVSLQSALDLDLDAVVLSANSIEDTLWARAEPLRNKGIKTIPLYSAAHESPTESIHA